MLPELIYKEEKTENHGLLVLLGLSAGLVGFALASLMFPANKGIVTVVFASIPLVYPLTRYFLETEKQDKPHFEEIKIYLSLFIGQAAAFSILGFLYPESFSTQITQFSSQLQGFNLTGYFFQDTLFQSVLTNNLTVFAGIILISVLVASAGAFVLTWNASVLGVFIGILFRELPASTEALFACTDERLAELGMQSPSPVCYLPHASFELTGFIIAGITGSLISASIYREHFSREHWEDLGWLMVLGLGFVLAGAALETGRILFFLVSMVISAVAGYKALA